MQEKTSSARQLLMILGDQLNQDSLIFEHYHADNSVLMMAEVIEESIGPQSPSSVQRSTLFFCAMRHFAAQLDALDYKLNYFSIAEKLHSFGNALDKALELQPFDKLLCVLPGDERVRQHIKQWCQSHGIAVTWLADQHFITKPNEFQKWMQNRKQPRMEHWYRYLRKSRGILMNQQQPIGGKWNFDADNRKTFAKTRPDNLIQPPQFEHTKDPIYQQVVADINTYLPNLYGNRKQFLWPINREQALLWMEHFIEHNLPQFGDYQDAMWQDQGFLYHSLLSSSLNLKLLSPSEVIAAAENAYYQHKAPLNSVEGFIRQILGWREYVRGLYWLNRQQWQTINYLQATQPLPEFYWHGNTEMNCLRQSIQQVVDFGYGHHIQRLMVTGLYAFLVGIDPQQIERWYLAMFVDAVAWVEQPNTLAMSQFADGGQLASKPYIASGNYIHRMSNYCQHCQFNPKNAIGENACPFTTLYWDFIDRHQDLLNHHPRLGVQVTNWLNKTDAEQHDIKRLAANWRNPP